MGLMFYKIRQFLAELIDRITIWFSQKILGQKLSPKGLAAAYYHYLIAIGELKEKDFNSEYEEAIKEMITNGMCLTKVQGSSLLLIYELKFMTKEQRKNWIEYNNVDPMKLADVLRGYYVEQEALKIKKQLLAMEKK